jgi:hypothetical protein
MWTTHRRFLGQRGDRWCRARFQLGAQIDGLEVLLARLETVMRDARLKTARPARAMTFDHH